MWKAMAVSCNILILLLATAICSQKRGEAGLGMSPAYPKGKLCTHCLFSAPGHSMSSVHSTVPAEITLGCDKVNIPAPCPNFFCHSCLTGHSIKAVLKVSTYKETCKINPWECFRSNQWTLLQKLQKMKTSTRGASLVGRDLVDKVKSHWVCPASPAWLQRV